ncbi:hypothetical protein BAX93_05435 [Elizabethkingia meningoseptica]|uniref:hypothetical protein n=1 Tax=Elizabethkingia meningoseptica TaxID=238 RepID=UPI00099A7256|nr:hypothetical protein [Elizabethkingia meningoseptica]OPC11944.1 hypothetical protein BAX93_05435 [Elizabethkingia meningoseptica]
MENTLENKAKFFAQYYGQNVKRSYLPEQTSLQVIDRDVFWIGHLIINGYLELKSLEDITDEDFIEVAKICDFIIGNGLRIKHDGYKKVMFSAYNSNPLETTTLFIYPKEFEVYSKDEDGKVVQYDTFRISMIIDYLRSKGYALPWMGLSVEKLVEYGWVKLKNKES